MSREGFKRKKSVGTFSTEKYKLLKIDSLVSKLKVYKIVNFRGWVGKRTPNGKFLKYFYLKPPITL